MMITVMTTMRMMLIMLTPRIAIMTGCLEPNVYQSQRESLTAIMPFGNTVQRLRVYHDATECDIMYDVSRYNAQWLWRAMYWLRGQQPSHHRHFLEPLSHLPSAYLSLSWQSSQSISLMTIIKVTLFYDYKQMTQIQLCQLYFVRGENDISIERNLAMKFWDWDKKVAFGLRVHQRHFIARGGCKKNKVDDGVTISQL